LLQNHACGAARSSKSAKGSSEPPAQEIEISASEHAANVYEHATVEFNILLALLYAAQP
jgi:hypothetical protein